jgi:hypothetical protein
MKKLKLLLLLLLVGAGSTMAQLQQIKIVSFTVKNQLPASVDSWNSIPGSLLLIAQLPPNIRVKGVKLVVQIKSNGAIVCGNNSTGGMQVDDFTTRTFSANELTGGLAGCSELKDGSYSICVQFYNIDKVAVSNEVCKEFTVETPRATDYAPPTLINPENGKSYTEAELSRPVTFRWTPLVPKPREPVTYRLKVWQLMQGQNGTQAMRSNQPIVTKDVDNITQAVVSNLYTGPCKPPYMCEFIWAVQALNKEGKPIGRNEGNSDPYTFKVETNTTTYSAPQLVSPNDGKAFAQNEMSAPVFFRWTPLVPKPQAVTYRLKVWQLMQGQNGTQAMRSNQPIITKDVDNITQAAVTGIYTGPCKPPYMCNFVWQVQALDRQDNPVGSNEGKSEVWSFNVKENGVTSCSPPKLSVPADGKNLKPEDAKTVKFSWGPVLPKSQEPVTYRLKVWQLMQGQNGTQAMRSNKPVVEKDVTDITEATVSSLYTGPCKPPYMCAFIWEVQALTREGKPACSTNEGKSEPATFSISTQYIIQLDSLKVVCTNKPGQYSFSYIITNLNSTTAELVSVLVQSSTPAGATITFSPAVGTTIAPSGGTLTVTGVITGSPVLSNICIKTKIQKQGDVGKNAEDYLCEDVAPCRCDACDEKNFTLNAPAPGSINISGNTISFNQPVTITTTPSKTIKTIKAELVYYEMVPENDMCIPCNKDAATYGHFTNGTNSQQWNGPQANLDIKITTPQLTPCCSAVFKWCIRYKVEFTDCTSCNKLVCYEKKKEGCEKNQGGIK